MTLDSIAMLGEDGPIARRLEGYEPRPQQVDMVRAIGNAMNTNGRLLVEAGTGVGKSFAYLIPAIQRIIEHGERVVIATNTIALQEQLIEKDIPLLNAIIPDEFTAVLVKGRGNYLSLRRLRLASERQDKLFADDEARHSLHTIEDWAYATKDGTLATLPQLSRQEVWDYARSDTHNCMGRKCPTYDKCFYQSARRRMENADLLICNHALFFSDLALRGKGTGFLPPYDHVILDEGHCVEDVASDHFGASLSQGRIDHLLKLLYQPKTGRGFLKTLRTKDGGTGGTGGTSFVDAAINHVESCRDARNLLFDDLWRWLETEGPRNGRYREALPIENPMSDAMAELAKHLRLLRDRTVNEADEFELNSYAQRAADIASETDILLTQAIDDCAYWVESNQNTRAGRAASRFRRVSLHAMPIDVHPILRERLFGQDISVTITSATLANGPDDFSLIADRLGCESAEKLQLGSPFDHAAQMQVVVDRTMPGPQDPRYVESLCPRILKHIEATGGGAFVLFTSFAMLRAVADRLRPTLVNEGHPVLVQGADGPPGLLLKRFRDNDHSVLLGTSSFWQGVDVRGQALRNVIITRLPFDVPDRPLIQARHERITEAGGNPFMQDQVPRAVIRFKQGVGRLIRSSADTGRVVVLDPRIATKPYGRQFLAALPQGVEVEAITESSEF